MFCLFLESSNNIEYFKVKILVGARLMYIGILLVISLLGSDSCRIDLHPTSFMIVIVIFNVCVSDCDMDVG